MSRYGFAGLGGLPAGVTQSNFDEAYYLAQNPDVVQYMVANPGTFSSGWDHFQQGGYAEGRKWKTIDGTPDVVVTTDVLPIGRDPNAAAFVRGLYQTYFGRDAVNDMNGWNFWTLELINGRKTRAEVESLFANDDEARRYAAGQNAQTAADAARLAQQQAEARVADLQAQIAALKQLFPSVESAAAHQAQITALQTQLAAAQAAAAAAGSAADAHQANADDLLSQAKSFVSSHKLIVGGIAAAVVLMVMSSGGSKKGSWF
jgi:uncharacterized protein DUF4214